MNCVKRRGSIRLVRVNPLKSKRYRISSGLSSTALSFEINEVGNELSTA